VKGSILVTILLFLSASTQIVAGTQPVPTPHTLWQHEFTEDIILGPVIDHAQNLYVVTADKQLQALDARGQIRWRYQLKQEPTSPVIGPDNTLYLSTEDQGLMAISDQGKVKWSKPETGKVEIALSHLDALYAKNTELLYRIDTQGYTLWQIQPGGRSRLALVGNDDTAYLQQPRTSSLAPSIITAISYEGFIKWETDVYDRHENDRNGDWVSNKLLLGNDNTLYVHQKKTSSAADNESSVSLGLKAIETKTGHILWERGLYGNFCNCSIRGNVILSKNNDLIALSYDASDIDSPAITELNKQGELKYSFSVEHPEIFYFFGAELQGPYLLEDNSILLLRSIGSGKNKEVSLIKLGLNGDWLWELKDVDFHTLNRSTFYSTDSGNLLKAFTLSDLSLENGPWSQPLQNNQGSKHNPDAKFVLTDTDGDGIADIHDPDNDNDGAADHEDQKPFDASIISDIDHDGIDDSLDPDMDGDGIDNELDVDPKDANIGAASGEGNFKWKWAAEQAKAMIIDNADIIYSANKNSISAFDTNTREYLWKISNADILDQDTYFYSLRQQNNNTLVVRIFSYEAQVEGLIGIDIQEQNIKWRFDLPKVCDSYFPSVTPSQEIVFTYKDCTSQQVSMVKLDPYGQLLWKTEIDSDYPRTLTIATNGTIYLFTSPSELQAYSPEGQQLWQYQTTTNIISQPVVGSDGMLYFASTDTLYAFNPLIPKPIWEYKIQGRFKPSLALSKQDGIYIIAYENSANNLLSLSKNGVLNWKTKLTENGEDPYYSSFSPYVTNSGDIQLRYRSASRYTVYGSITEDFTEYNLGLQNISALGILNWDYPLEDFGSRSAGDIVLTQDGAIVVSLNKGLTAINSNSGPLADSAWPSVNGGQGLKRHALLGATKHNGQLMRHQQTNQWQVSYLGGRNEVVTYVLDLPADPDWQLQSFTDLNNDGYKDVLLRNQQTAAWQLFLVEQDNVTPIDIALPQVSSWQFADSNDYDGDGINDLLLRYDDSRWMLYTFNGTKITSHAQLGIYHFDNWQFVTSGDFNADGFADFVLRDQQTGQWQLHLQQNGEIQTSATLALPTAQQWQFQARIDLDSDNKDDLLLRDQDGNWQAYHLDGKEIKNVTQPELTTGTSWNVINNKDFDLDGHQDLLLHRQQSGRYYQYFFEQGKLKLRGYMLAEPTIGWQMQ